MAQNRQFRTNLRFWKSLWKISVVERRYGF